MKLLGTYPPIIGAFAGLRYVEDEATLEKGDLLILYTAGFTSGKLSDDLALIVISIK